MKSKRKMSIKILDQLKSICKSHFNTPEDKSAVWTACCTAFFASARMGELLANLKFYFDLKSTLLWKDVYFSKEKIVLRIKSPKSSKSIEKLYVFPFAKKSLCPFRALKKLKFLQKKSNLYDRNLPVFRFASGHNVTKNFLNRFFRENLNTPISCHAFRNAIPSLLADFPAIANDMHTMGWGRWRSKAFLEYQKSKTKQKKWVFNKIQRILLNQL
jgi:hypothetical protein